MYLCYETSDHPKWQNVRYWFEEEHAVTKDNVDAEGSPVTPKPDLSAEIFEEPAEEQMELDKLPDDFFDDPPARDLDPPSTPTAHMDEDEANVAEVFGDFDPDMEDMESSMVDLLNVARILLRKKEEDQDDAQINTC